MLRTIEGVYRNGHIELAEVPNDLDAEARVLVTFLPPGSVDLQSRGISEDEAAQLRKQLASFAEDWESPEMSEYDDYDNNRRKLETG
jgi:hypothetical protein